MQELTLQWGHAWIGVGMEGSNLLLVGFVGLQWGHAWIGVGIRVLGALEHKRLPASMGPRLDRRGNLSPLRTSWTSMLLQWGHAWIGVGIMRILMWPLSPRRSFNGATPG